MNISHNEALKEMRKTARENGLVFKKKNMTINGNTAWKFEDRQSGEVIIDNVLFWTAYEDCQSGFIESCNKETGNFER